MPGSEILLPEPIYQEITEKPCVLEHGEKLTSDNQKESEKENGKKKNDWKQIKNEKKIIKNEVKVINNEEKVIKDEEKGANEERLKPGVVYGIITAKQVAKFIPCSQTSIVRHH